MSFLLSVLIGFTFLLDIALRRIPISRVAFRPWEVSRLYRTSVGPNTPNFSYFSPKVYGDLANAGNLPQYRVYRRERFTTDALGFRYTPQPVTGGPIRIVLWGDSFIVGAALSDEQTLAAQLAQRTGVRVYNAGGIAPWEAFTELLARLQIRDATVILEIFEDADITSNLEMQPPDSVNGMSRRLLTRSQYGNIRMLWSVANGWPQASRLRIYLTRAFRALEDNRWLPNSTADWVSVSQLRNGHYMLFWTPQGDLIRNGQTAYKDSAGTDVSYFLGVQDRVRKTGNRFLVVMVPSKYRVYNAFLRAAEAPPMSGSFFGDLVPALARAGVPAVDLTPVLFREAARLYESGQYAYHLDDTHWSPLGVRAAADAVAEAWRKPH